MGNLGAKMAATRVLSPLILFFSIPWDTVYDVYLPHRGGPKVCDGISTTLRSCGDLNEYILDFAVEHVVVRRVKLHQYRALPAVYLFANGVNMVRYRLSFLAMTRHWKLLFSRTLLRILVQFLTFQLTDLARVVLLLIYTFYLNRR